MHKRNYNYCFSQLNQMISIKWISLIALFVFGWMQFAGAEESGLILNEAQGSSLTSEITPVPTPVIKKIVVLDPGHGGKNHGIVFQNYVSEKQLALQVALQIKTRLKRYNNIDVFMTRRSDMDLPIIDRVMKSNRNKADVFVSIHSIGIVTMNKNPDQPVIVVNKFIDDQHLAGIVKDNLNRGIKVIPWELAQNGYIGKSKRLAKMMTKNLIGETNSGAAFLELPLAILTGIRSAAVLLELPNGMPISDEAIQKQFVEKMATQIADGIVQYLY